jgi:hypothetical protein
MLYEFSYEPSWLIVLTLAVPFTRKSCKVVVPLTARLPVTDILSALKLPTIPRVPIISAFPKTVKPLRVSSELQDKGPSQSILPSA